MSTSGLAQVGIGAPAPAAIGDAIANPSTVDVAALQLVYNGATWDRVRTPNVFKQSGTTAAGSAAIWTPAAGKKFRLMRYLVTITADATMAAAGRELIQLLDGATALGQAHESFVPAAALNNGGVIFSTGWVDLGNGYLSTAANNVLNLNITTALVTGLCRMVTAGTEE